MRPGTLVKEVIPSMHTATVHPLRINEIPATKKTSRNGEAQKGLNHFRSKYAELILRVPNENAGGTEYIRPEDTANTTCGRNLKNRPATLKIKN